MLRVGHMPCCMPLYPSCCEGACALDAAMTQACKRCSKLAWALARMWKSTGCCRATDAEPALNTHPSRTTTLGPDAAVRVRADHGVRAGPAAAAGGCAGCSREGGREKGSQGRGAPRQGSQAQEGAREAAQGRHACCKAARCCQVGAACAAVGFSFDVALPVKGTKQGMGVWACWWQCWLVKCWWRCWLVKKCIARILKRACRQLSTTFERNRGLSQWQRCLTLSICPCRRGR